MPMTGDLIPDVAASGERSSHRDWAFRLTLGLSLAVHGGVAAALLSQEPRDFGATDLVTAAISVNIVPTDIVQATQQSPATQAAPASATSPQAQSASPASAEAAVPPSIDPQQTVPEPPPPQPAAEDKSRDEVAARQAVEAGAAAREAEARDKARQLAEDELRAAREADARDKARQLAEDQARAASEAEVRDKARKLAEDEARATREGEARDKAREAEVESERREEQAERKAKEKRTRKVASAGTSGANGGKSAAGQVSASQGALQNYKRVVDAWMQSRKPAYDGKSGDVVILIALAPSGSLISARVYSSSGNQALDLRALSAARQCSPFPKPPAGATAAQLRFTFPYKFR